MGRAVTVIWHASFSILAAGLYFFFVLPRWPELMGQTSPTLGLVLRIVAGVLIGLTALPVVFTLQRTQRPELATPQLALRLRAASISLHVLAAVLIVGTAVAEIWLSLDNDGQWLFGIYGAAAAIALLGIFGFYLAFVAELPPPPPKPLKTREKTQRRGRKQAAANAEEAEEAEETSEADKEAEKADDSEAEETEDAEPVETKATVES
ncbi:MFS family permease [Mycobacterium frederiksbergense]|uniref:MFS family permease n=1 Tax=Mycolicibacterium frederiksbergense TaxID=117567 RepID=A0ABT6L0N7_9MYCO|nr:MFS family permease [Mycolicibacterium frederiksbergense]